MTAAASCLSPCRQVSGHVPSAKACRRSARRVGDQPALAESHRRARLIRVESGEDGDMHLPLSPGPPRVTRSRQAPTAAPNQRAASISRIAASAIGSPRRWANSSTARATEVLHRSAIVGCSPASSSSSLSQTASAMSKFGAAGPGLEPGKLLEVPLAGNVAALQPPQRGGGDPGRVAHDQERAPVAPGQAGTQVEVEEVGADDVDSRAGMLAAPATAPWPSEIPGSRCRSARAAGLRARAGPGETSPCRRSARGRGSSARPIGPSVSQDRGNQVPRGLEIAQVPSPAVQSSHCGSAASAAPRHWLLAYFTLAPGRTLGIVRASAR